MQYKLVSNPLSNSNTIDYVQCIIIIEGTTLSEFYQLKRPLFFDWIKQFLFFLLKQKATQLFLGFSPI